MKIWVLNGDDRNYGEGHMVSLAAYEDHNVAKDLCDRLNQAANSRGIRNRHKLLSAIMEEATYFDLAHVSFALTEIDLIPK